MPKHELLNPEYLPTPLVQRDQRQPIPVDVNFKHPSSVRVLLSLTGFLLARTLDRLLRRSSPLKSAIAARELLQGLGGIWVKLGQLLSLRSDLLSDEMCDQLSRCLYSNVAFPSSIARAVVERALQKPISQVFSSFDDKPLAAASIAQVHRAVLLEEGVSVVVKVLRPGVGASFKRDMRLLRGILKLASIVLPIAHLRLNDALIELNGMVEEELDYSFEAYNLQRLRRTLRKHKVYVPYLFTQYANAEVLVMEEIKGVLMSEAISVSRQEPRRFEAWCQENTVNTKKVASHLFLSNLRQLLEDNLFHGDMHPGNIILLRHNRYALIDFGTIGTLEHSFIMLYVGVLKALSENNYDKAASLAIHMSTETPSLDLDHLKRDLIQAMRLWQAHSSMEGMSYYERSLGASTRIIGNVFAKYRLQISWTSLRMARTWGTLDSTLAYFYPDMSHARMFDRYLKKAKERRRQHVVSNIKERAVDFFDTAYQYRLLLDPVAQRSIIAYKQKLNKISLAISAIIRFILMFTVAGTVLGVYAFLYQHYIDLSGLPIAGLLDDVPALEKEWFLLILIGLCIFVFLLRRLLRISTISYLR